MLYRRFGRTEIQVPIFTCGGMRYQYKWQDTPLCNIPSDNQINLEQTVYRAIELGINHIETARGYGSSERQLGCILPALDRNKIIVQTKIIPEYNPHEFINNFHDSLARLRLDYVDLLALHGINNREILDWSIRPNGCLQAARKLQNQGYARHIGFSTHAQLDVILDTLRHEDDGGFDYINLHWYYIFQNNWPAIIEACKKDMGVFIISPSDKGGMLYNPSNKLIALTKPLHPIVFNDLFCLSHPEICTLSIGASRPTDFDRHLETIPLLDKANKLLPPIIKQLEKVWLETIGKDFANHFTKGLPDWENTPGNINIPIIIWLHILTLAYDMTEYAQMRYNLLGNGGHWFPGENADKIDQFDFTKALEHSPIAEHIPNILREAHRKLWKEPVKRLSQSE